MERRWFFPEEQRANDFVRSLSHKILEGIIGGEILFKLLVIWLFDKVNQKMIIRDVNRGLARLGFI